MADAATDSGFTPLSRDAMAQRVARDIEEGWYVNLGIGMPTRVADFVTADREIIFHSENGLLGFGPAPEADQIDPWLVNAGKQLVTLRQGASLFHHADSFAMIRGGHIDLCIMGGFQVAENGDFANWAVDMTSAPAVGGAMDLAAGAKRIWIMMDHITKQGAARLLERCTYPLTALAAVERVYTNYGVIDVRDGGFHVVEMAPGMTAERMQAATDAKLNF